MKKRETRTQDGEKNKPGVGETKKPSKKSKKVNMDQRRKGKGGLEGIAGRRERA